MNGQKDLTLPILSPPTTVPPVSQKNPNYSALNHLCLCVDFVMHIQQKFSNGHYLQHNACCNLKFQIKTCKSPLKKFFAAARILSNATNQLNLLARRLIWQLQSRKKLKHEGNKFYFNHKTTEASSPFIDKNNHGISCVRKIFFSFFFFFANQLLKRLLLTIFLIAQNAKTSVCKVAEAAVPIRNHYWSAQLFRQ